MTSQRDLKKSKFPALTSALTTDYFDFVRNNQNYRITLADLITAMGVSGPLQTLGDITGTPILNVDAGVNYIRNILGGSGITVGLSAQNGVEIEHNFDIDKTGAPVMINETASQPTIRSIVAGTGIAVAGTGDIIQISTSGTPGSTKTVQVFEEGDFPTAVTGVITLAGDTEYRMQNDVSTTSRFVMGAGTVLSGADNAIITLTYTGSGNMITALDNSFKIKNVTLMCTSGTLFDVSSTTGAHKFTMFFVRISCANVGTIDNYNRLTFDFVDITAGTQGLILTNNFGVFRLGVTYITIASGTGDGINIGVATFDTITFENVTFDIDTSGSCIVGTTLSANINTGGLGSITRASQFGSADLLDGLTPYDSFWEMFECAGILDSTNLILTVNTGVTITIAAAATPVIIGPAWNPIDTHRFTGNAAGRATYTGKGAHLNFTASISMDLVSGIDDVSFFLYKNGVQIANSRVTREVDSGNIGNIALLWSDEAATGDYYEIWVQNDDTNVNVIISNITLRID